MHLEPVLQRLAVDGWCVLENVIPADKVGAIRDSILATIKNHSNPDPRQSLGKVSGLINYDQSLAPYLAEPRLLGLCKALLGEHVRISFTTCLSTFPGNQRGLLHADWPFNQLNTSHIPAPYPDAVGHLTTIWMLSPFTIENGGTPVVSGSHRARNNPSGDMAVDMESPYPTEVQATGPAGSVLVMDSRLWHAIGPNRSSAPRVAVVVRFAPWWLNLDVLRPGSDERKRQVEETGRDENLVPLVPVEVFDGLPDAVKPLFRHWVEPAGK